MRIARNSLLIAAFVGAVVNVGLATADSAAASDRLIRRCSAEGSGDISMAARYEKRDGGRKKFTVEMEAAPGGAFRSGQRIEFIVAGVKVGSDRLETVAGGDLVGEINFDTKAGPGDDEDPFPRNFPAVSNGTKVKIERQDKTVLACALR